VQCQKVIRVLLRYRGSGLVQRYIGTGVVHGFGGTGGIQGNIRT
jgi:hypothetical protein